MATARSRLALCAAVCAAAVALEGVRPGVASAQSPAFGLGRPPAPDELKAIDIDVAPDGAGLPPGGGTAAEGRTIYARRCETCHGPTGREGPQDVLAGGRGTLASARPLKTVGSYWPYATTLFDYLRRAMPFDHPGTMTADEVYATTAYLLFLNGIVGERDVIDRTMLPKVRMPNRDGFVADPRPDIGGAARKPAKKPKGFGFRMQRSSGSQRIYGHPSIPELLNLQDVAGEAKPYQIRRLLRLVERYNLGLEP